MSQSLLGRRRGGHLSALLLASLVGACSDGYPTQENVLILSHGMSRERVLSAMNHLGHQQPSDFHWHYQLLPGCVLEVHARRFWGDRARQQIAMNGAEIRESRSGDSGDHTVSLVSRSDPVLEVVVLERMDEVDASQMVWLLNDLPRLCAVGPGAGP